MATGTRERPSLFERLGRSTELELHLPGDPGYDEARRAWNLAAEHRPLAVAAPRSTRGVVEVVEHARAHGLTVGIQSTGHGVTRPIRDAVLIDMSRMTHVDVDPVRRRARIAGGAKWRAVLDVVVPHGLAPLLGSTPDVSAVGYTLGGGLGWLGRKYGTSADSVVGFEIVTADGRVRRVTAGDDPELFWALRGAGAGHLGVVTAMEIDLYPITELYAGNLFYPAELARDVLRRWRDWLPSVPVALTSAVTMLNVPDEEEVPAEIRGRSFVLVRGAFDGPRAEGERLLEHWRSWRTPAIDAFGPMPFARVDEISDDPLEPLPYEGTGVWLGRLGDRTIDELVGVMFPEQEESLLVQTELRHYGDSAVSRAPAIPSAFGNRDATFLLELVGVTPTPELVAAVRELIRGVRARIAPDLTGGVYLNYVEGSERRHGIVAGIGAEPATRLAAVKARVDPGRLFDWGLDAQAANDD